MADALRDAAHQHIETVQKRLIALQSLGIDTSALASQLSFARELLREQRFEEVETLCEDLLTLASGLAKGAGDTSSVARALRANQAPEQFAQDQLLADRIKDILEEGLLEKVLGKQGGKVQGKGQAGPVPVRLNTLVEQLGQAMQQVLQDHQQAEVSRLRHAVRDALQDQDEAQSQRMQAALDRVLAARGADQDLIAARLERLEQALEGLRQATSEPAPNSLTVRIAKALRQTLREQALPDGQILAEQVGARVEAAMQAHHSAHDGAALTTRIAQAVGEAVRKAGEAAGLADLDQRVARLVAQSLEVGRPSDVSALAAQVVDGMREALKSVPTPEGFTQRLRQAVSEAVQQRLPGEHAELVQHLEQTLAQVEERVRKGVVEDLRASEAQTRALVHQDLATLLAQQLPPALDSEALVERIQERLGAQLEQLEHILEQRLGSALSADSQRVQAGLEQLIHQVQDIPQHQRSSAHIQVAAAVEQIIDANSLRQELRSAVLEPLRAELRRGLDECLGESRSGLFLVSGSDLEKAEHPRQLLDAEVAEAIDDLIDGLIDDVGHRLTRRMGAHVAQDMLNRAKESGLRPAVELHLSPNSPDARARTPQEDPEDRTGTVRIAPEPEQEALPQDLGQVPSHQLPDNPSTATPLAADFLQPGPEKAQLPSHVQSSSSAAPGAQPSTVHLRQDSQALRDTDLELESTPAQAVSASAILRELGIPAEPSTDSVFSLPTANAAASPAQDPVPGTASCDDYSPQIGSSGSQMLSALGVGVESAPLSEPSAQEAESGSLEAEPSDVQPGTGALARDLLYALTEASMPEESRTARVPTPQPSTAARSGSSQRHRSKAFRDLSQIPGGGDTAQLVKEALRRGEAAFSLSKRLEHANAAASPSASQPAGTASGSRSLDLGDVQALVTAEVARQMLARPNPAPSPAPVHGEPAPVANAPVVALAPSRDSLRSELRQILPELLAEPAIQSQLFACLAYQMLVEPGVLQELAGLRGFVHDEVRRALQEQAQPV